MNLPASPALQTHNSIFSGTKYRMELLPRGVKQTLRSVLIQPDTMQALRTRLTLNSRYSMYNQQMQGRGTALMGLKGHLVPWWSQVSQNRVNLNTHSA